jgi:hypothetical protein
MATERFTGNVKWGFFKHWPCFVEIVEEVEKVISGLMGAWGLIISVSVAWLEWEADIERLIDEEEVPKDVPGGMEEFGLSLFDSDGSNLGESSKLWAGSGPTLQPDNKRHISRRLIDPELMPHGGEEIIVHTSGIFGEIPINLFVA